MMHGGEMPNQQYFSPETLPPTRGYSQVVKVGSTVYIAGQVGVAFVGTVVRMDDALAHARQLLHYLEAAA
jgi:enamine deaminase RidA (YjgF/YER057c/UK114 family)